MSDGVPRHPAEETLAAFVEGALAPPAIAAVAEHLRGCTDCRTAVAETARFYDEEQKAERPWFLGTWWLASAAAMVIVVAAAISIPMLRRDAAASTLATLIESAPRDHRGFEPRVSGFPWARLQAPSRGSAPVDPGDLKLSGAAGVVLEKSAGDSSAASQHAAGVAYLLVARTSESVAALERAANASNDAHVWNDLAAVHYVLATTHEQPSHLPLALAAVDRALRLDGQLAEAHFNRALILERLGMRDQARSAWVRYLELDPSSGWSVEARAHLRPLESHSRAEFPAALKTAAAALTTGDASPLQKLVRDSPQDARSWGEGPLLAGWADAEVAKNSMQADAQLAVVRTIGTALVAQDGDRLLADAVAAIDRNPEARPDLAAAQQIYHRGRLDYRARALAEAAPKFRRAAELFRGGGSPLARVASFYAASATLEQGGSDDAREELSRIYVAIDRKRYRALAAQIQWELAVDANVTGDWGTAAREAAAAGVTFVALGELANAANADAIAAHALEIMGEGDLAWKSRLSAMAALSAETERGRRALILHSGSIALASHGDLEAAVAVMDLVLAQGDEDNPVRLATELTDRARLAERSGDSGVARRQLDAARAAALRITDPATRDAMAVRIDLAEAVLQAQTSPRGAIAALDRCVAFFEGQQRNMLPDALLQRARAHRKSGDDDAALADYEAALRAVDAERRSIAEDTMRLALLDTAAQIIDESVALQIARGNVREAFAIADHARAGDQDGPVTIGDAAGVALIEYALQPDSLVIFTASHGTVTAKSVPADRRRLAALVASFAENIRRRATGAEVQRDAAALHRLLIEPLQLAGIDELVIVPDRELYGVPFAALFDARRQRYLVEDFTIRFAPSASMPHRPAEGPLTPALVVADPSGTRWPKLNYGREEAGRIAALYGAATLAGDEATLERFMEAAPRQALIHYAGHADSDATHSYGALLLAGDDAGVLGSSRIARQRLPLQPLVVLAACGTFRGDPLHVAGMASLARAFLTAGARTVVGTLWEIDDDVAAPLFLRFHQEVRTGAQPARALRSAQLAMLRSEDERLSQPATWGSYETLGSP
jgi:CHAT domain-containing protein